MESDVWDLLSPRYFSSFFVALFDNGWWAIALIFPLLFFGTVIWPLTVQGMKWLYPRSGRLKSIIDKTGLKFSHNRAERMPPGWIAGRSRLYRIVFGFSLIASALYIIFHRWIQVNPAEFLTTGSNLQWLPNGEFRALIRFLYQWVLTGYALVVLSLTLGLDSLARWMMASKPPIRLMGNTTSLATMLQEARNTAQASENVLRNSKEVAEDIRHALAATKSISWQEAFVAFQNPAYLVITRSESKGSVKEIDRRILHDDHMFVMSTKAYIEQDPKLTDSDAEKPLLMFKKVNGQSIIIHDRSQLTNIKLEYRKTEKSISWRKFPGKSELSEWLEIRWQIDDATYYCRCERYVKI